VPDKDPVVAQTDPAGGVIETPNTANGIDPTVVENGDIKTDEVAEAAGGLVTVIVTVTVIAVAAPTGGEAVPTVPENVAVVVTDPNVVVGVKLPANVPPADQVPPVGVIVAVVVVVVV